MFDTRDGQHLARLLLISKMRNLANDVSHDQSVLIAKIFGATTTRHFLTLASCVHVFQLSTSSPMPVMNFPFQVSKFGLFVTEDNRLDRFVRF